jgi:hypothetical protein
MIDKTMNRWNTYDPFFVELIEKKIADVFITHHAKERWFQRIDTVNTSLDDICSFIWEKLKSGNIIRYYPNDEDFFLIDDDLVIVAEFNKIEDKTDLIGNPLHKMIIITFLGRMSENIELRDLKQYYSWLRHSRRMTLIKSSKKRK